MDADILTKFPEMEDVGCSTPVDSELCKKCKRNSPHEEFEEFRLVKKLMNVDECSGYIHKEQRSLF